MAWWKFGRESKSERQIRELREMLTADAPVAEDVNSTPVEDDADIPFVMLRGEWDPEREGFKIEIDWNALYLKQIIPMGVEGESEFEIAAYGVTLLAHQILEQEQQRRANETNQILAMQDQQ